MWSFVWSMQANVKIPPLTALFAGATSLEFTLWQKNRHSVRESLETPAHELRVARDNTQSLLCFNSITHVFPLVKGHNYPHWVNALLANQRWNCSCSQQCWGMPRFILENERRAKVRILQSVVLRYSPSICLRVYLPGIDAVFRPKLTSVGRFGLRKAVEPGYI